MAKKEIRKKTDHVLGILEIIAEQNKEIIGNLRTLNAIQRENYKVLNNIQGKLYYPVISNHPRF